MTSGQDRRRVHGVRPNWRNREHDHLGKQRFNHVGIVHLLGAEAVDEGKHLRGVGATIKFSCHGLNQDGIDEGLITLHIGN